MMIVLSQATFYQNKECEIFTFKGSCCKVFDAGSKDNIPPVTF